jgi:isochorismate hydrolase
MVKDATADYSEDHIHAALDINIPNYASAIVTTNEVIESISFLETLDKKRMTDPSPRENEYESGPD